LRFSMCGRRTVRVHGTKERQNHDILPPSARRGASVGSQSEGRRPAREQNGVLSGRGIERKNELGDSPSGGGKSSISRVEKKNEVPRETNQANPRGGRPSQGGENYKKKTRQNQN